MANHYYDKTGVLMLEQVTPVIRALFGTLDMNEAYPGNGEVYIAIMDNGGDEPSEPRWEDIHKRLIVLMGLLDLPVTADAELYVDECLSELAAHFRVKDSDRDDLIIDSDCENHVDLQTLFRMAICFDDGHHLKAIKYEGAQHCSEPELFQFSGNGGFLSRHIEFLVYSSNEVELGETLHEAIDQGNIDDAAQAINWKVELLLASLRNKTQRNAVRKRLVSKILSPRKRNA